MKCRACDNILTDKEATRKDEHGEFLDLCFVCIDKSKLGEEQETWTLPEVGFIHDDN